MRGKKLLIAGITLLTLVSLLISSCGGSIIKKDSYSIAHQEEPVTFEEGRVKENPARLNLAILQTVDLSIAAGEDMPNEGTMHDLTVKTTELLRGDAAWAKLKTNPDNQPAPDGYEYILVKVQMTLKAVASSTRWFDFWELIIDGSKFIAYSSAPAFEQYPFVQNAAMPLDEQCYGSLEAGKTLEGYILVEVPKTDLTPILEYISPDIPMYYKLYK
jgi:hypothetical protein